MKQIIRLLVAMAMTGAIAFTGLATGDVTAQEDEGFPLGVVAAMCPEDYAGPFAGCEAWVGAEISVVSDDGTVNETCVAPEAAAEARTSGCSYEVPFGSTITATLVGDVPDGWVLSSQAEQTVEIPVSPPDGIFGGPTFVLLPAEASGAPTENDDASGGVEELPTTGRGSDTAADTQQVVAEQIMLTVLVLAAVVSVAFGGLALYARQRDL